MIYLRSLSSHKSCIQSVKNVTQRTSNWSKSCKGIFSYTNMTFISHFGKASRKDTVLQTPWATRTQRCAPLLSVVHKQVPRPSQQVTAAARSYPSWLLGHGISFLAKLLCCISISRTLEQNTSWELSKGQSLCRLPESIFLHQNSPPWWRWTCSIAQ